MDAQETVATFLETHDLRATPPYRALDLSAEVGEIAAAVSQSTDYGANPESVSVPADELGDALFALLALAEGLDIDAETALETALTKYEARIDTTDDPSSGS
jgi:NTP pyrophosphatase (non-canonical NTP hydrolase)